MVIFGRLCEVISYINKNAENADSSYGTGMGEIPSVIHNVVRYVRENYQTITGVDEIADRFYINSWRLPFRPLNKARSRFNKIMNLALAPYPLA